METRLKYVALAAALAFAACTPAAEAPPASRASTPAVGPAAAASADALTPTGWSALKIGMTKAEVIAAVGDKSDPDSVGGPDEDVCTEFHPARAPEGLYVMIEEGKLSRITITELSTLKTSDGFGVGDNPAAIKTFYGARATASPHQYQEKPAEYVTVWEGAAPTIPVPADSPARGFVYEVDATGKVGAIHAGNPSIQYVEGCL